MVIMLSTLQGAGVEIDSLLSFLLSIDELKERLNLKQCLLIFDEGLLGDVSNNFEGRDHAFLKLVILFYG